MVLSGEEIRRRAIITPHLMRTRTPRGLSYGEGPAGYDVRIGEDIFLRGGHRFALASIVERIEMPDDVLGIVHDKSSWARMGLSVFNTVVEPGWQGWLTIELAFKADRGAPAVHLKPEDPVAQIIFHQISGTVSPYVGTYQDQGPGVTRSVLDPRRGDR
jgi:dCTP deaminase